MLVALPTVFFILLAISVLSALFFLSSKVPINFVRIHVVVLSFPPIAALFALVFNNGPVIFGPWRFDSLSWLLAVFVLTIGLIVQRYSVHYLFGDRCYRKYFTLLTFTTVADSLSWLSDDLRLLLLCWGATLLGLTWILSLKKEWQVAGNAAFLSGRLFVLSWFVLLAAIIWVAQVTGQWRLSLIMTQDSLSQLGSWERTFISLLLVLAVVIPAAQWPFGRWLLDSVVAPTPVSAVMHAGIVNAGGMILTRFAPLFGSSAAAQTTLLVLSSISVLIGTGIMLVQVDYKRQLVGSTIAQMGFMLIQCALGAYLAAIVHAVLHGLFKSTLFLQAGSAAQHNEPISRTSQTPSFIWTITSVILGLLAGIGYVLASPGVNYQLISAITLGWSVTIGWMQLITYGYGHIGRLAGLSLFAGAAIVYSIIHGVFSGLLHATIQNGTQPPVPAVILLLLVLLSGSAFGAWASRNRSSRLFAVIYLWLVRLGEPNQDLVESHPRYLSQSMSQGGNLR